MILLKKWVIAAVAYLAVVIGAYYIVGAFVDNEPVDHASEHDAEKQTPEQHAHDEEENSDDHAHHDHGDSPSHSENEVFPNIESQDDKLVVTLLDEENNPVDDLKMNHEKYMHLIVVSEDMETFLHLHPERIAPGVFEADHLLSEGMYKVYVDIVPTNLAYEIEPLSLMMGDHAHHEHGPDLTAEQNWTKTTNGYEVTLTSPSFSVQGDVLLQFEIDGGEPEQYLGALGHVVIIDESMEQFIHVHPTNDVNPTFNAHFTEAGLYKLWAEFKLDGKVYDFPFVIEITE